MSLKPLCIISLIFPSLVFAAQMTNNIAGVGPINEKLNPYICVQNQAGNVTLVLPPGKSGDANQASGNSNYVGATIRFGGCGYDNSYLGYVGFSLGSSGKNAINSYSPPQGVPVAFVNPSIDSNGSVNGAIDYTLIPNNLSFYVAKPTQRWKFAGINLSGLEFGKLIDPVVIPNLSQENKDSTYSDLADTESFIKAGMNTVRIPVSWGYLQWDGAGLGTLNHAYYDNYVRPLLQTLTHAKVNTIIDLHAYMRYSKFGQQYSGCGADGPCPDGTLILDKKAYLSVWGQLYDAIRQDPLIDQQYILLDLMNEPVDVPNDFVFSIQTSLIHMLRERGFTGYILVEGNRWSGLHSWSEEWTGQDGQIYSNRTLFSRANFEKAGIFDLSKIVINAHQYLDSNYSGTGDSCQQNLMTTGPNAFNLNEFVDYLMENRLFAMVTEFGAGRNSASCAGTLDQFVNYLSENSANDKDYGFLGWTIWASGHGWGNYNLRVTPTSYQMNVLRNYLSSSEN